MFSYIYKSSVHVERIRHIMPCSCMFPMNKQYFIHSYIYCFLYNHEDIRIFVFNVLMNKLLWHCAKIFGKPTYNLIVSMFVHIIHVCISSFICPKCVLFVVQYILDNEICTFPISRQVSLYNGLNLEFPKKDFLD